MKLPELTTPKQAENFLNSLLSPEVEMAIYEGDIETLYHSVKKEQTGDGWTRYSILLNYNDKTINLAAMSYSEESMAIKAIDLSDIVRDYIQHTYFIGLSSKIKNFELMSSKATTE